jgi:uncharacterized protein YgiB involved in biofilm formation
MSTIQEKIHEQLEEARAACDVSGVNSAACAAAYDALEELQAEAAHQQQSKPKSALQQYCEENPDAAECRIYDD